MKKMGRAFQAVLLLAVMILAAGFLFRVVPVSADWEDWDHNVQLEVQNNATTALPSGYTVRFTLNTSALIGQGQMRSDCADLRISYDDGVSEIELDRLVEGCNTAATTVTFRTGAGVPTGGVDTAYRCYYGDPTAATPPQDPGNVYAFYDDFEDGDAADWTPAKGTWSVVDDGGNHIYRYTGGGANWAISYVNLADVSDLDYVARIRATNSPMTTWIGSAFRIHDANNFMTFYQSRDTNNFKLAQVVGDRHTVLQQPSFTMGAEDWYWLRLQAIGSQVRARIWAASEPEPTGWNIQYTTSTYQTATNIGATLYYHDTEADWDDIQVRRLVDAEPSVVLHWETAPWWDNAWGYRARLTVTNPSATDVVPAGYAVAVTLDTSALIAAGQMLGTCDDLRVVSFDGVSNTELDRVVEGCGTADTRIWFPLAQPISASGMDENYYLYYGNALAGPPPADGMSVFVFFEDWEQSTTHWTGAGGLDPANTGTMGLSVISTAEAFSPDHSQQFPQKASGGDAFSGYIPVAPATRYAIGTWGKSATPAYAPVGFDPYDSSYNRGTEVWLWTNEWTVPSTWARRSAGFTTGASTAYIKIKSEWWSEGPGTEPVYLDNLLLRYAMTAEPTIAIGDEETILPVPAIVSVDDTGPVDVGTPILVTAVVSSTQGTIDTVTLEVQSPETSDVAMALVAGDALSGTWQCSFVPAEGGLYTYRVFATASTGRSRLSAVYSFDAVDTLPPQITLDSITDPILVRDTQTLTVTVTDNGRVSQVIVEIDGDTLPMTHQGDQYEASWRVESVGTLTYTVRATDTAGNSSTLAGDFESMAREVDVCIWKDCKSGAASFSMDDGNTSCRTELENAGFRGTYYYNGASTLSWFATYSAAGHEVGSHSVSHPCDTPCCTPNCTPEALWDCPYTPAQVDAYRRDQIEPNVAAIEAGTGLPVVSMAWPCGCADGRRMTAASYYFLGVRGYYDYIAQLQWVEDVNEPTPLEFMNLNSGHSYDQTLIDRAIAEGKWAIITSHGSCAGIDYMGGQSANLWLAPVGTVLEYIYVRDAAAFSNYSRYGRTISFDVVHTLAPFQRQELDGTPMSTIYFDDPVTLMIHILDSDEVLGVQVDGTPVSFSVETVAGTRYVLLDTPLDVTKQVSVTLAQPAPTIEEVTDSGVTEFGDSCSVTATVTIEEGTIQDVTLEIVSPESASYPMSLVDGTTDTYEAGFTPSQLLNHTYRVLASNDEDRTSQSELRTLVVQDTVAPLWQGQSQASDQIAPTQANTLSAQAMDIGGLAWAILATDETGTWQEFDWPATDWWNHDWPHRRQITVTEGAGLARSFETVDLFVSENEFPGLVDCAAELRVADEGGQEVPVQVYDENVEAGVLTCRLQFQATVEGSEIRTYYVYYGNASAGPPSYATDLTLSAGSGVLSVQNSFFDLDLDSDAGVVSRIGLPAGSSSNLPLSPESDHYWGWHQVCSSVHGNITGKDQLCSGGSAPASGLAVAHTLDGPIAKEIVFTSIRDTATYSMTFRFFAHAPYYQYALERTGTSAAVMNNFWYANGNFGRLGTGSGGSPATSYNTYSYSTDQVRMASFAPVDYGSIDGTDNDGTQLGGTDYRFPSASGLSLYVTTGSTQGGTEGVLARLESPVTVELGPVEDVPEGQYGSPMVLAGVTNWTQTDFVWQNAAVPDQTEVHWYIKYCDGTGNCVTTGVESFFVEEPTAVTLASFTAEAGAGYITLDWETAVELNNLGFHLYRSEAAGGLYTKLNDDLIPSEAPGSMQGASYSWEDRDVVPGVTYHYKLESVDIYGRVTPYGPILASLPEVSPYRLFLPLMARE